MLDRKTGEFRPELARTTHVDLVVDDQRRDRGGRPSIGRILNRGKHAVGTEDALRGIARPVGAAESRVTATTDARPDGTTTPNGS